MHPLDLEGEHAQHLVTGREDGADRFELFGLGGTVVDGRHALAAERLLEGAYVPIRVTRARELDSRQVKLIMSPGLIRFIDS
ncbi:hypothetical protein [Kitasatospora sp. SC0581]|uniref:hypothetical protein n=1 Tax=Kitasatospora sp. SC0581 TaxID=3394360 RepID=UPI003A8BA426